MNIDDAPVADILLDNEKRLRRIVDDYEARFAEIEELVSHVRHEVNNPLTGVLGQAQLLLREDLNDSARHRVETIQELAIRIRDTVALLREMSLPDHIVRSSSESQEATGSDN